MKSTDIRRRTDHATQPLSEPNLSSRSRKRIIPFLILGEESTCIEQNPRSYLTLIKVIATHSSVCTASMMFADLLHGKVSFRVHPHHYMSGLGAVLGLLICIARDVQLSAFGTTLCSVLYSSS